MTVDFKFNPDEKVTDVFDVNCVIKECSYSKNGIEYWCVYKKKENNKWLAESHLTPGWR